MVFLVMPIDNSQNNYKEIDYLPRWAYHDDEWSELILSVDKIIGKKFFKFIVKEKDELEEFLKNIEEIK